MRTKVSCLLGCLLFVLSARGQYAVTVPNGFSLIANHLDRGGNTLDEVLPSVPGGTSIQKWTCSGFQVYAYDEFTSSWNPGGGTLKPGEGAVIQNPGASFVIIFSGTVHVPVLPLRLPCGCGVDNLVSRQTNGIGTYDNITGLAATEGAKLKRGVGVGQVTYTYSSGNWTPSVPSVNVGEAVWVNVPCNPACLTLNCPTNKTVSCGTAWSFNPPTAVSTCCSNTTVSVVGTVTNGSCPQLITRTWRVTDCSSNTATCSQIVTNLDTTPPLLTCATNKTVQCGTAWTFDAPIAFDACCTNVAISVVSTFTNPGCPQILIRTWRAVDCCNNTNFCNQIVTNLDTTPPLLTCATNKTVQCGSSWTFDPPTAADSCCTNLSISVVSTVTNGICPKIIMRTWRAVDCCNNTNFCSQMVTNLDTTPPLLTCATNKTVQCGSSWTFDPPTAADSCCGTNVTVSVLSTATNGSLCSLTVTRTWRAVDCCNNSNNCSQTVTVIDTTPPVITCVGDKTAELNWGNLGTGPIRLDVLFDFDGVGFRSLMEASDGIFYGTDPYGTTGKGAIFKLNPDGTGYQVLHDFTSAGARWPEHALLEASDGALYGTTTRGGDNDRGTIFKINKDASGYTLLWSFTGSGGDYPFARLTEGSDGVLYGTTAYGGSADRGTLFKINKNGSAFQVRRNFLGARDDGDWPDAALLEDSQSGTLFGSTRAGGVMNLGSLFKLNKNGSGYSDFHGFHWSDGGMVPSGGLVDGGDDKIYGYCVAGGLNGNGTVYRVPKVGVGFEVILEQPSGTTWFEGSGPVGFVRGMDGALYGTSWVGHPGQGGHVFKVFKDGSGYQMLYDFRPEDGQAPLALFEGRDKALYGVTALGGRHGGGTVFRLASVVAQSNWNFDAPVAFDNCCGTNVTITIVDTGTNFLNSCLARVTRTWRATDCCSNSATCSQTIIVGDTLPPVIVCPSNKTVNCVADIEFETPRVFDQFCRTPLLRVLSTVTNSLSPLTVTRTWLASDCCGLTNSCTQTMTALNAPPINDDCSNAIALQLGTPICGSTLCATPSPVGSLVPAPCGISAGSPDVWYSISPTCTGPVTIDTCGGCTAFTPKFDTVLTVYAGACDSLTRVICNDDAGRLCGTQSRVVFDAVAGATYLVRVSGHAGASGQFRLNATQTITPPPNDLCMNATVIGNGTIEFNTCGANTDGPTSPTCPINNDVWFRFTPACSGLVWVDTCRSGFDTAVAVYTGACGSLAQVACNNNAAAGACSGSLQSFVSFNATANTTIFIRVGAPTNLEGSGRLTVHGPFPPAVPASCPPPSGPVVTRIFHVLGHPTGTSWAWSLTVPCCLNLENLNVPGVNSGDSSTIAAAFAGSINAACPSGAVTAQAFPGPFFPGLLIIKVRCGAADRFMLRVGPAGTPAASQCVVADFRGRIRLPSIGRCTFNPDLVELPAAEADLNGNGVDDAVDILTQTSLDVNDNGIPDEAEACLAPILDLKPQSGAARLADSLVLRALANGTQPMAYQWSRNETALADDARISGSSTDTLTIRNVSPAEAGDYTVLISNACGSITSAPVAVTVQGPPAPQILSPLMSGGYFQFSFATELNAHYLVEVTEDLVGPASVWLPLENVSGDGTMRNIRDPLLPVRARYYRVSLKLP